MDKTIRRNEHCVIGLPGCDFVFSSTRSCFISYGFEESGLERSILVDLLEDRGIQAEDAGGSHAPGQSAFCAKICSKIITSQFCVVILNNREVDGVEIPSANVHMEYGLILGFNKYVVPFQRGSQKLPFNVAGLDTIKYSRAEFGRQAEEALDVAIASTQQEVVATPEWSGQYLDQFLLTRRALVTPLDNAGERAFSQLGEPLGFRLLNDFSGFQYMYFGNFTALRTEVVAWRVRMLAEIIDERRGSMQKRVDWGMVEAELPGIFDNLLGSVRIWVVVTSDADRDAVVEAAGSLPYELAVFSVNDIRAGVEELG